MNHHVPCSGVPPDDLLDLIYHYKALLIRQLHLWFAGRETAVDHLLRRLEQAERIRCDGQRAACNAPWLASGNPACELAFWCLLDFRDSVEYQLPGSHGVTIAAFTENGEYDLIAILPRHEQAASAVVQAQRDALGQRLIVVLQSAEQIQKIKIHPVTAYCVVSADGQTTYYTTAKEAPSCQPPMTAS